MQHWEAAKKEAISEAAETLVQTEQIIANRLGLDMRWRDRLAGWIGPNGTQPCSFANAGCDFRRVILLSHRFDAVQSKWKTKDTLLVQTLTDLNDAIEAMEFEDEDSFPAYTDELIAATNATQMMLSVSTLWVPSPD